MNSDVIVLSKPYFAVMVYNDRSGPCLAITHKVGHIVLDSVLRLLEIFQDNVVAEFERVVG